MSYMYQVLRIRHVDRLPGHPDLCDKPAVFENASEHKLVHCGPDVADIYCSVSLQGVRGEGRAVGNLERASRGID